MNKHEFTAVDRAELIRQLGGQCSPDRHRKGYVVGPVYDRNGKFIRRAHVASCFSLQDARNLAEEYNKRNTATTD